MKRILLSLGVLCCCVLSSAAQSSSWPSTLLWRISGNGLTKDSYLFGSMHLQDKRIFHLSDSLYHYLEKAEGFAMEIDVHEYLDSILQKAVDEKIYGSDDVKEPPPALNDIDDILEPPPGTEKRLSKREIRALKKMRQEIIAGMFKTEKMPVILDMYLYALATRMGKWAGGIEDVTDQLQIMDEIGRGVPDQEIDSLQVPARAMLEKMIAIYLAQDLNAVDTMFLQTKNKVMEDIRLIRRNYKMADRMDSLGRIRSMFFTVGTAHLPGTEGVIVLLRKKGFTVEPVFGSAKIDPDVYRKKVAAIAWKPVSDDAGTFSIEMPGKTSDFNIFGEALHMKMAYDILDQEMYIAGSFAKSYTNEQAEIDALRKRMKEKVKDMKKITHNGMSGLEGTMNYSSYRYKIRYLVGNGSIYMLMNGGDASLNKKNNNTQRFFNSFKPLEAPKKLAANSVVQSDTAGYFAITWPGQYRRSKSLESRQDGQSFSSRSWDLLDIVNTQYNIVQVLDLKAGLVLESDSAYFEELRAGYHAQLNDVKDEWGERFGYAYYQAQGFAKDEDLRLKSFTLIRGNRVYQLISGVPRNAAPDKDSAFFASFRLLDYPAPTWTEQVSPDGDFRVKLPSALLKRETGEDPSGVLLQDWVYVGSNPVDATSYRIEKQSIGDYTEVTDTLKFLEETMVRYELETDSVLSKREVRNGTAPGLEWTMVKANSHTAKQLRVILHGDSLYILLVVQQEKDALAKRYQSFFDSFTFTRSYTANRQSKSDKLLNDMLSADSATYFKARNALYSQEFTPKDLPRLRQLIVTEIPGDTLHNDYFRIRFQLAGKLYNIGDDATVDFLTAQYAKVPATNYNMQDDIIHGLASIKSTYAYQALLKLLLEKTPSPDSTGTFTFSYRLYDSLELTRTLYPGLLQLLSKPHISLAVIDVTDRLLKDDQLDKETVRPYLPVILKQVDSYLRQPWSQDDRDNEGYSYVDMLHLLGYFPDTAVASRIRGFLSPEMPAALNESISSLIRMKQPVPAKSLNELAGFPLYRRDLYALLDTTGNKSLFPAKYKNQRSFAESELLAYFDYEEWTPVVEFVKEKKVKWKGKEFRVFLFQISDEGLNFPMLGIAGPYALDQSELQTNGELTGYHEEAYKLKDIDKLLQEYLKQKENQEAGD